MSIMQNTIKQSCTTADISDFIKANKDASYPISMSPTIMELCVVLWIFRLNFSSKFTRNENMILQSVNFSFEIKSIVMQATKEYVS